MPIYDRLQERSAVTFHLLQYSWGAADRSASVASAARSLGMPYTPRAVWRRPQAPATAAMMLRGAADIVRYVRRHHVDVLMPRSIIPAGMALLARHMLPATRLIYDADGLMADERLEFGGWSREGKPYRMLRAVESAAVRHADAVITRTSRARTILSKRAGTPSVAEKIVIVPNGKSAQLFDPGTDAERSALRGSIGVDDGTPLVVYAGSLGPHYLPAKMFALFLAIRRRCPGARLVVLTGSPEIAHRTAGELGVALDGVTVCQVAPAAVPQYLAAADLGLGLRMASFSQQAVAPIKVGEYLLCGIPVLSTRGIGDIDDQIDSSVGYLLGGLDEQELDRAAEWFVSRVLPDRAGFRQRCRELGMARFSHEAAVEQYGRVFARVAATPRHSRRS